MDSSLLEGKPGALICFERNAFFATNDKPAAWAVIYQEAAYVVEGFMLENGSTKAYLRRVEVGKRAYEGELCVITLSERGAEMRLANFHWRSLMWLEKNPATQQTLGRMLKAKAAKKEWRM